MAAQKHTGLGRGLGELFQNTTVDASPEAHLGDSMPKGSHFLEIPVESIRANPQQPRTIFDPEQITELSESIKEVGLLQPIVVRPLSGGKYELVMGERRLRATKEAGLTVIPAIIRPTEEEDLLRDALLENIQRVQLNPLEEAAAYQQLLSDFGCTQEELATRIKKSRPQISNTIRLLRLPTSVQKRVAAGVLSAGHARALLGLEDTESMERLAAKIVAEGMSVRATEEAVALSSGTVQPKPARGPRPKVENPRAHTVAAALSDKYDTRVVVEIGAKKGKIVIEFAGEEDLDRILNVIEPGLE
ncbi:MAG: ParB/RepB/Spo0J family partition protein [Propionibacteriaceae bacterium]|nr:ParB/RepB/Spo0J family partition protein [Propionibacteriaceae bacterium]